MIPFVLVQAVGMAMDSNGGGWSTGSIVGTCITTATVTGGGIAWLLTHIAGKEKDCRSERAELHKQIQDMATDFTKSSERQTDRFIEAVREDRKEHRELLGKILRRQLLDGPHDGPHP